MATLGLCCRLYHQPPLAELASQGSSGTNISPATAAWSGIVHPAFQAGFEGCVELLTTLTRLLLVSELTPPVHTCFNSTLQGSKVKHNLEQNRLKEV